MTTATAAPVARGQRFTREYPCPICGGHDHLPAHRGVRCWGFRSSDGLWAHCARPEHAGGLREGVAGYAHRLDGPCRCGRPHGEPVQSPMPPPVTNSATNQDWALALWRAARAPEGTPAELYLRRRGYEGAIPPSIRYLVAAQHPGVSRWPCMVAAVGTPDGRIVAVHRTYVTKIGQKAPVDPVKAMLGPCAGGAVWLALPGPKLAVTEGIETGLSVMQISGLPSWAALSASGMKALVLPPPPVAGELVICADFDRDGLAAAEALAGRATGEGRLVRIAIPTRPGADWNDEARGAA